MSDLVERWTGCPELSCRASKACQYGPEVICRSQLATRRETKDARITELETALAEAVAYMWTDPTHQRPPELHWHYDTGPAYEGWIITPLCAGEWKK